MIKRLLARNAIRLVIVVAFFLAWENFSGNPQSGDHVLVDELLFGKPSKIWDSLVELYNSGTLFDHVRVTTFEALVGFAIGCAAGMLVGLLLGVSRRVADVVNPLIAALYAVPRLALTPLFIIWFGVGWESKVALVTTIVFFLVFYATYSGVREVDAELRDVLRVMDASTFQLHRRVTLPAASVWVIASLRVAVPYAFVAAVVGEMISSSEGLGYLIGRGANSINPSASFAGIFLTVVLALLLNGVVTLIDRRASRWKIDVRSAGAGL